MSCSSFSSRARHRVTLQCPQQTADIYGGQRTVWTDVGTYWTYIEPLSGRELWAQQALQSRATHRMTIRYQSALKDISAIGSYRAVFDDRQFALVAIRNLHDNLKFEGRVFQELLVEENGPNANEAEP